MNLKQKLSSIIEKIEGVIYEKEEIIKLTLLGLISGENIFLLGQPGVAKSLMARQVCQLIKDGVYFEYLMNSFSTPEELFGPISLKKLDEDIYERKIENYLPESNVVFLDEIWKASPAIQNTLLNIINEKIYINGSKKIDVPLKLLISASNELPLENEGLDALYDRFIIRIIVNPISEDKNFFSLLKSEKNISINFEEELKISLNEIEQFEDSINQVKLSDSILNFILIFKNELTKNMDSSFYVSDRRWKKIAWILKSVAFANNRNEVDASDLLIIKHLVWKKPEQIQQINEIFETVFNQHALDLMKLEFNKVFDIIDQIQQDINTNSSVVKKVNMVNKQLTYNSTTTYVEFATSQANVTKKYLLPVGVLTDRWGSRYMPYGFDIHSKKYLTDAYGGHLSFYYYEKFNDEWIQKTYNANHFKLLDDNSGYEFNGQKVVPVESSVVTINNPALIEQIKQKVNNAIYIKDSLEYSKDSIINYIKNDTNKNILIPNYTYYQSKLLNLITQNFTKIKVSIDSILEQINNSVR